MKQNATKRSASMKPEEKRGGAHAIRTSGAAGLKKIVIVGNGINLYFRPGVGLASGGHNLHGLGAAT